MSALADEIKAAVREVLREELPRLLAETLSDILAAPSALPAEDDLAYTVAQVAKLSGYTPDTILEKISFNELKACKPAGGREWRVLRSDYLAWLGGTSGKKNPSPNPDDVAREMLARSTVLTVPAEQLWGVPEVAKFLRLGRNAVYEMAKNGELPSVRVGSRVRFVPKEIKAWFDKKRGGGT